MHTSKKPVKMIVSLTLALSVILSLCLCAFAVHAEEKESLAEIGADTYYFYGLNTNDPNFGSLSGPTGTFSYDSSLGYYYDITDFAGGDYCFFVSKQSVNGDAAIRSMDVSKVGESGSYYLTFGNYHGYSCMHIWNPNRDPVRVYFSSPASGLYAVKKSSGTVAPTSPPVTPTNPPVTPTTTPGTNIVYLKNDRGWSTPHVYMWNGDGTDCNAAWPGAAMTKLSGDVWYYNVPKSFANVIFNMGSDADQTGDLSYPGTGKIYSPNSDSWSNYGGSVDPTSPPSTQKPTSQPSTTPSGKNMVYCKNAAGWSNVYVYMWTDKQSNGDWPGKKMTNIGDNIWSYEVTGGWKNIIFNAGSDQTKTADMTYPGAGRIYNNSTGDWEIYDTSPLQVKAFRTDVESPQFNGVSVTLSASAVGQGTVYYKFSVKNAAGALTSLSSYTTKNYAVWTPTVTGTYTLVYEFKDTAGNTNSRTSQFKIEDGSSSVEPYIKSLTPSSGEIKKGASCTLNASAGGGFTGTKLLFYKYTITDPSGKTCNTPYFTRNTSYSFTPSSLGKYTVVLTVQGSDNKDVSRSYVLDSVTNPSSGQGETMPVGPTTAPGTFTMRGDADNDGTLSVIDATTIQKYLASIYNDSKINKANADVDSDNTVSIMDATFIQKKLASIPTSIQW